MATVNKSFRVKNGLTVEGGSLYPVQGSTSTAPIILTSGTNLTTAAAGAFEFDGTRFYLTPSSTRQAIALTDATGVTLSSTITASSLTSVGTLANLTVTNPISGSVTGAAGSVGSSFIIKADTGTTEGTDLYTFNGSAAKTLNIVGGANITITKTAGQWSIAATGSGNGTVQSVSVTSANGFAGTVANATTTPAITLTTSITGVLKGNGTAISAATAGTDYVVPSGSITGSAGSVTNALTIGTGLSGTVGTYNGSAAVTVSLPSVGTAGTYTKVTTDAQGRVSSGTTLSASDIPTLGNITNAGAIGSTSGLVIITGASGVLSSLAAGTTGQYLQYNGTWSTPPNYFPTAVTAVTSASPTTNGPTLGLTMNSGTVTTVDIPAASATVSGAITTGTQTIAGAKTYSGTATFNSTVTVPTPTNATDAANKQYVDNVAQGVNAHDAVQVATTGTLAAVYAAGTTGGDGGTGVGATITFSATGTTTLDTTITLVANDRVLVKDGVTADAGTASKANGIYYVSTAGTTGVATVLTRALDYDNSIAGDIVAGDLVYVIGGTANGTTQWIETTTGTATTPNKGIKIGTDGITFTQFSGANATTAGAGLSASGNVFNVGTASSARIVVNADNIDLAGVSFAAGAASGTATSFVTGVTVDAYGRTTATASSTVPTATSSVLGLASFGSEFTVTAGAVTINSIAFSKITGTVPTSQGGTNLTTFTSGGAVYATSTSVLTTGTLPVASGGTGATTLASNGVLLGNGTSAISATAVGSTNQVLLGNTGAAPTWGAVSLTAAVSGTLPTGNGGTGLTAFTSGGAVYATSTSALTTGTLPVASGGTGVTTSTGTGSVVLSASPALTGTVTLNAIAGSVTASGSTTGTTPLTMSTVYSVSTYTGGEFIVKSVNGSNIEIIKVLVISDGTNFYVTQYGDVQSSTALATVDFSYTSTNVNMVVTPVAGATGTTSVKVAGTLIAL